MGRDVFEALLARGPTPVRRDPATAVVTRSGDDGVFVTLLEDDPRTPLGPCRGGRRRNAAGDLEWIPKGTTVLLVWTDDGPWITAWEETE